MAPPKCTHLNLQDLGMSTLCGKRDWFWDAGIILDYLDGPSRITWKTVAKGGRRVGWKDATPRIWPTVAVFEDGGRGHEPRNVGHLQKLQETKEWNFSQSLQRGTQPCWLMPWFLAQRDLRWSSDLHNSKIINHKINKCCFKSLSLWSLAMAAIENSYQKALTFLSLSLPV